MLVSKNPCGPNATPQREPIMPNASPNMNQWNMVGVGYVRVGFAWGMYISCCLFPVPSCWEVNANAVFNEIWT